MSKAVHAEVINRYRSPEPCPNCGGDQIDDRAEDALGVPWQCHCIECGHRGPGSFTRSGAVAFWNREEAEA